MLEPLYAVVSGAILLPQTRGQGRRNRREAGITESIPFHGSRHTFTTLAIQQGVDVKTVSGILGHCSAGSTLNTYAHVTQEMRKNAADRMGEFIAQAV